MLLEKGVQMIVMQLQSRRALSLGEIPNTLGGESRVAAQERGPSDPPWTEEHFAPTEEESGLGLAILGSGNDGNSRGQMQPPGEGREVPW